MSGELEPRVYVACLACYNAARLEGEWFDADETLMDAFDVWRLEHLQKTGEGHEEYLVHDFEGFGPIKLGEVSVSEAQEIGAALVEHGIPFALAWNNAASGASAEDVIKTVEEGYRGEWDSLEDYAANYAEETGMLESVPENLRYYFDFEKFGRDMELNGDVWTAEYEGKVYVFDNCI